MERHEVIQRLLALYEQPSYLEIGVHMGATFGAVRAARKVAVDVRFAYDWQAEAALPDNAGCSWHETASDAYFADARGDERFDLVFIDGLHSYEQVLRDLLNSWAALKEGGLIVVDDILPSTYAASIGDLDRSQRFRAATGNPDWSWMGDVYRLAFFVEAFMPAFSYATVEENHGQMILWRDHRPSVPATTVERTTRIGFVDTVLHREVFRIRPYAEIEAALRAWRAGRSAGRTSAER